MTYSVRGIEYKVLPKKLDLKGCGDIPKWENCCKCNSKIVDTCYFMREKPDKFICNTCFGNMFIEFDKR